MAGESLDQAGSRQEPLKLGVKFLGGGFCGADEGPDGSHSMSEDSLQRRKGSV